VSTKTNGYAPDLFSEHARAAQLGLFVVELARAIPGTDGKKSRPVAGETVADFEHRRSIVLGNILTKVRELFDLDSPEESSSPKNQVDSNAEPGDLPIGGA